MTTEEKPREWWVEKGNIFDMAWRPNSMTAQIMPHVATHVIEISALYAAQARIKELEADLYLLKTQHAELEGIYEAIKEENDKLLEENERYQAEMKKINAGIPSEWAYAILQKKYDELKINFQLRADELTNLKNSLPETHWAYWRKRAGEMTDAWRDTRDQNSELRSIVDDLKNGLFKYSGLIAPNNYYSVADKVLTSVEARLRELDADKGKTE